MNTNAVKILALLVGLVMAAAAATAADTPQSAGKWDEETLELFASIPVQEGGRIKPLDTLASLKLLNINGKRYFKNESGGRLTPLEWLLDCLFYPEIARDYANFRVTDSAAVTAMGAVAHDDRMDYYSYHELVPGRSKLFELARQYSSIEKALQSPSQRVILGLAYAMSDFEALTNYFDFARQNYPVTGDGELAELFPERSSATLSSVLAKGPDLQRALANLRSQGADSDEAEMQAFRNIFASLEHASGTAYVLALFPPTGREETEWRTPADLIGMAFESGGFAAMGNELTALSSLEHLVHQRSNMLAFKQNVQDFHSIVVAQARERGEYAKIPLEIRYYKGKYLFYAQWLFVVSFLLIALSWLGSGKNPVLNKVIAVAVSAPWLLLVVAIVLRCVIRGRPPVTTLYETILFVCATAVLVALFIEYVNRQRVAIAMASFFGVFGVFLANKYELSDKQDTMPSMVAVLDTNFWLSTHVTTIVMGYAAGLLAAGVAHIYILGKLFNVKKNDAQFYHSVTRMVYGILAFGLVFSFVGTVLGGIWANYSWGRFWGWDPKENGALLIVLCNLAILHARLGGYLQDLGLHLAAIFAGCIVAFSWWGVNLLGVGLHSYGFTAGIWNSLIIFWGLEALVMFVGLAVLMRERAVKAVTAGAQADGTAANS